MSFVATKNPYRVFDAERSWELTLDRTMGATFFKLTHVTGAHIVFTAVNVPIDPSARTDGIKTEWRISSVGHKPVSRASRLTKGEQQQLIREALSAYGFFYGEDAGPTLLHF